MTNPPQAKQLTRISAVGSILLIVTYLLFVVPASLWLANAEDMTVNIHAVLRILSIWALCGLAILGLPVFLLSGRWHERYVAFLLACGVSVWVQGNLLVWKCGLLNGQAFDFSQGSWRGWVDASIWLTIFVVCLSRAKVVAHKANKISAVIMVVVCMTLVVQGVQRHKAMKDVVRQASMADIASFSSQTNVIHLVLDGFQSTLFETIIQQNPSYTNQLEGFTFFKDTIGSFPTTYMSYPAFVSGRVYNNDVPMSRFVTDVLEGNTLPNVLHDRGYVVDLVMMVSKFIHGRYDHAYTIPVPYRNLGDTQNENAAQLVDLTLFRVAPFWIKPFIYNDQNWLFQSKLDHENSGLIHSQVSHRDFFTDYQKAMSVSPTQAVYKILHLGVSHSPAVLDREGRYRGHVLPWTQANHLNQAEFALSQVLTFLNRLRELGVYDRSIIVIHSDHGAGHVVPMTKTTSKAAGDASLDTMVGSALPLLAIKPIGATNTFRISTAQAALTDLPITVIDLLSLPDEFPGRPAFKIQEGKNRLRHFAYYAWEHSSWDSDYFPHLDQYRIDGSAFKLDSWHLDNLLIKSEDDYTARYIQFGTKEAFAKHLISGWASNEQLDKEKLTANWALGSSAKVLMSLPKDKPTQLLARVRPWVFADPQQIAVFIDNELSGRWTLTNAFVWQMCVIDIPTRETRPNVSTIEFRFRNFRATTNDDARPLAVMFESITLKDGVVIQSDADYVPQTIQYGTAEALTKNLVSGWGGNEQLADEKLTANWALGESAKVLVALPYIRSSKVIARVRPWIFVDPQQIEMLVDKESVGQCTLTNAWVWQTCSFDIPANEKRPNVSTIEFRFRHHRTETTKDDPRPLAVMFESLRVE